VTTRPSKPYTGYKSFQYLEPGVDYQPFRLAREVGRVEPYVVPVSPEQERTVQEILDEELVIDHVAFGPDTMFGDHVGIHHAFARQLSIPQSHQGPQFNEVPTSKGSKTRRRSFRT
jgi:hypothetical protein